MKLNKSLLAVALLSILVGCGTTSTPTTTPGGATNTTAAPTTAKPGESTKPTEGVLTSLEIAEGEQILSGTAFADHVIKVNGVYSNGEKKLLDASKYEITLPTYAVAKMGKKATVKITSKEKTSVGLEKALTVYSKVEGESGLVVGGNVKTEASYSIVDEEFVKGEDVTFAGGFGKAVNGGNEGSVTLEYDSYTDTTGSFTVRMSNANLAKGDLGYYMNALQFNSIIDVTVNGEAYTVSDDAIIPGTPEYMTDSTKYAPCYGVYHDVTFKNVSFHAGINKIKFNFKKSTLDQTNYWEESPSESNIDYVLFASEGKDIDASATITAIEVDKNTSTAIEYGTLRSDIKNAKIKTVATLSNGDRIQLEPEEVEITAIRGENTVAYEGGEDYVLFGTFEIEVQLKSNPAIKTTATVINEEVESIVVKKAWLEEADGRVLYKLSGEAKGVASEEIRLFDGSTTYAHTAKLTPFTFELTVDATDYAATSNTDRNCLISPHMSINGVNYNNGDNANGDIKGHGIEFTHGEHVILGNKAYVIEEFWGMPGLFAENFTYGDRHFVIANARLVEEDGKIYYTLSGRAVGSFEGSSIELYDGSYVLDSTVTFDAATNSFELRVDTSTVEIAEGETERHFYPHLRIDGVNYPTGGSGDVKNYGLVIENAKLNNDKVEIYTSWSMPVLKVMK